jgi:argininosuccinate lyase
MLRTMRFHRDAMAAASSDELLGATDLADLLVRRGVPFRDSHGMVAGLVRRAVERGGRLSDLTDADVAELAPALDGSGLTEVLGEGAWLESKVSEGGTSLGRAHAVLREAVAR